MQQSLLHQTAGQKKMEDLPLHRALLKHFTTNEIINWPSFEAEFAAEVAQQTEVFGGENGAARIEALRLRVTEHNILVVSKYYSQLTLARLSQLLSLPAAQVEKHISDMVVAGSLRCKMDRPAGLVVFRGKQDASQVLNAWSGNIEKLLGLVETSCHQIHKEMMTHKIK